MTELQTPDRPTRPSRLPWQRRPRGTAAPQIAQYTVSAEKHDGAPTDDFTTIARRLPALCAIAPRLAWAADRRALLLLGALQVAAGVLTAAVLYGARHALVPLFADGQATERLRAALPALLVITATAGARSAASALTLAVTARIGPRIDALAELRFLDATGRVPLAFYDDPAWCDHSEAANRASKDAHLVVDALAAVTGALLGILASAGTVSTLHPLFLPLLLLAVLPRAWAAVRAAGADQGPTVVALHGGPP
ncbi:hypothetical protein [Kitasatospora sp. NPDC056184]|uniref:hypothetical protein n=1 Tax=Kitasatospora sp. NPDC056184 TaxID=3345738 RepID=UPI0035DC483A